MDNRFLGEFCSTCGGQFVQGDVIAVCGSCGTPQHLFCWQARQGCAVPGCQGRIGEIVGTQMKMTEPQPVLEYLWVSETAALQQDAPVAVEKLFLLKNETGEVFVNCLMRCMVDSPISAVMVDVHCKDVWGNPLVGVEGHQYLDLNTRRGDVFGQDHMIKLPDVNARGVSVQIKKVLFADGEQAVCSAEPIPFPAMVALAEHYQSQELAEQYARETQIEAVCIPMCQDGIWRCACGNLNYEQEEYCPLCGSNLENLQQVLTSETLEANLQAYLQEQQQREEEARTAWEEQQRKAALKQKIAEEHARKLQLEAQIEAEEERKRKLHLLIGASVAAVVILLIVLISCVIVPSNRYKEACELLDNGAYDQARAIFIDLDDYKESRELAQECLYQKAASLVEQGEYDLAIPLYQQLGNYYDSAELLLSTKYKKAKKLQEDELYKDAYLAFTELDDYKDSSDCALANLILWEASALSSGDSTMAEDLAATVSLDHDQHLMFYGTLLLFIEGHDDIQYWHTDGYSGGTSATDNVLIMLDMLPETYEKTASLKELFKAIDYARSYYDLYTSNKDLLKQWWSLGLVKDLVEDDDVILEYLKGDWSGSGYYIQFYEKDGSTWCSYDLPHTRPYGTKYYDIENMIFYFDDANNKHLAEIYKFEFVDYNTMKVYCYKNYRTYTMYR